MAQPFRRAWDILKQGPYDRQNPNERPRGLYPPMGPTDWPPHNPQPHPGPNAPPNPYGEIPPMNPTDRPPYEPQERPPSPNPYGEQPGDPQEQPNPYERIHPQPGPYDHTQRPQPYDTSSRISAIQTQIQQLEAELQRLLQMQSGGGGHPWER
jgi:hypothetical protein